jgi:two-component system, sensor histidine kinase and response regulator
VAVTAALDSSGGESMQLHITVRDTGLGIPPEKQKSIFAAFSQADSSTTRKYGGTGLGLTICSRLVELMHGKIWVESAPGHGSTFHFTARVGLGKSAPAGMGDIERELLLGVAVLIVDDNLANQRILADTVRRWGMKPQVETSAEAGLRCGKPAIRARPSHWS